MFIIGINYKMFEISRVNSYYTRECYTSSLIYIITNNYFTLPLIVRLIKCF